MCSQQWWKNIFLPFPIEIDDKNTVLDQMGHTSIGLLCSLYFAVILLLEGGKKWNEMKPFYRPCMEVVPTYHGFQHDTHTHTHTSFHISASRSSSPMSCAVDAKRINEFGRALKPRKKRKRIAFFIFCPKNTWTNGVMWTGLGKLNQMEWRVRGSKKGGRESRSTPPKLKIPYRKDAQYNILHTSFLPVLWQIITIPEPDFLNISKLSLCNERSFQTLF